MVGCWAGGEIHSRTVFQDRDSRTDPCYLEAVFISDYDKVPDW